MLNLGICSAEIFKAFSNDAPGSFILFIRLFISLLDGLRLLEDEVLFTGTLSCPLLLFHRGIRCGPATFAGSYLLLVGL